MGFKIKKDGLIDSAHTWANVSPACKISETRINDEISSYCLYIARDIISSRIASVFYSNCDKGTIIAFHSFRC